MYITMKKEVLAILGKHMSVGSTPIDWNGKSKCIRCGTPVASNRDFCCEECEHAFLDG